VFLTEALEDLIFYVAAGWQWIGTQDIYVVAFN
jgi:hypothetical protein